MPVVVAADVSVALTDSADTVRVNGRLTLFATVSNAGPSTATGVTLRMQLPSAYSVLAVQASQGSCSSGGCSLGSLASGAQAQVAVTVRPRWAGTFTSSATASAVQADPASGNNTAQHSTTVLRRW